jgi:uncharacterized protein YjiS (DUF1127 family)
MSGVALRAVRPIAVIRGEILLRAKATLATWRRRARERRELSRLSEAELRDFGIGRLEAIHEARKPFWKG